jgi:hypothetical protein
MPLPSRRECARSRGGWRYTPIPVLLDSAAEKSSRLSDNLPYAIRSRSRLLARGAGTVLISTTNLVTLPAPPSCYCVCRLQPPPLCAACSAFAAAVALLVLCLSIVCVPVCLLLSVRVCLREPLHVCMSEIVYQGVSFALLLSAPASPPLATAAAACSSRAADDSEKKRHAASCGRTASATASR